MERVRVEREGVPEVDLERYAAIIIGGSPFEVSTPEGEKSELQREIEAGLARLLRRVVEADFPFLGACSGCGLLGSFCGGSISTKYREPVGGAHIRLTAAGRADPLLRGFPERFRVLLGHKEACDEAPPGATLLATSEACPVQMFRIGENVYATQFHPEGDVEGFVTRIRVYRHYGYFPPETADELIAAVQAEETPIPQRMLRRFAQRYRKAGG